MILATGITVLLDQYTAVLFSFPPQAVLRGSSGNLIGDALFNILPLFTLPRSQNLE